MFIAAPERQANLFDGRELQAGLVLEMVAPGGECLMIGSWKAPQPFKENADIRTLGSLPSPMPPRWPEFSFRR